VTQLTRFLVSTSRSWPQPRSGLRRFTRTFTKSNSIFFFTFTLKSWRCWRFPSQHFTCMHMFNVQFQQLLRLGTGIVTSISVISPDSDNMWSTGTWNAIKFLAALPSSWTNNLKSSIPIRCPDVQYHELYFSVHHTHDHVWQKQWF
jgi:hypothetical protein